VPPWRLRPSSCQVAETRCGSVAADRDHRCLNLLEARGGSRLDVRALLVFFALAYGLSWSWLIPLAAAHQVVRRSAGWPTHYLALLGPAIAAVVVVVTAWTTGRPGIGDLLARRARWRVAVCWWLWAVSPAVFLGLALIAMVVAGQALPGVAEFGQFSGTPAAGLAGLCCCCSSVPWVRRPAGADMPCPSCGSAGTCPSSS